MSQLHDSIEFVPAHGSPGYFVSRDGDIISTKRGSPKFMKQHVNKYGHLYVHVVLPDGRDINKYVHHIVLETFVSLRPSGSQCRHLNGIHSDNRLENLMWGTASENAQDMLKHGVHPTQQNGYSKRLSDGLKRSYKKRGGHSKETKDKMRLSALKRHGKST